MSLLDSITDFSTGTYTVTRRTVAPMVAGKRVLGTASTFTITGPIQPATDMQRVVGGKDMRSSLENRHVDDVRMLYTETELYVQRTGYDADIVTAEDDDWTVFRVEPWTISGVSFYMVVITRQTGGGS